MDIDVHLGELVRLPDGATLVTDIYRPLPRGDFPVVMVRQPYLLRSLPLVRLGRYLAGRGFVTVIQAVRGTSGSTGTFRGFPQEPPDTVQVLDWLQERDWFSGRLCPLGISYSSYTGWLAAEEALRRGLEVPCLVNLVGGLRPIHSVGGALALHWALPWTIMMGHGSSARALWRRLKREPRIFERLDLDGLEFDSPLSTELWRSYMMKKPPASEVDPDMVSVVPSLTITGWYDLLLKTGFETFEALGGDRPGHEHVLVCGPWDHARLPADVASAMGGGANRCLVGPLGGVADVVRRWLEQHAGVGDGPAIAPGIYYFTCSGTNENGSWSYRECWRGNGHLSLYLACDDDVGGRRLVWRAPSPGQAAFVHDPLDPVPTIGGAVWPLEDRFEPGPADQSSLEGRKDVVMYDSEPLDRDLEVVGDVVLRLAVEVSATPADVAAKLVDRQPDGYAVIVCDTILRLRTRPSTERLRLDLGPVAYRFRRGHRIRLELAGSNFPKFDRAIVAGGARPATVRYLVREGGSTPSVLDLPVTGGGVV